MTQKHKINNREDKTGKKTISPKITKMEMDQEQNQIVLLRWITLLGAVSTVVVAVMGLLGYIPALKRLGNISEAYIPMAPSTAVSFIVLGGVLIALNFKAFSSRKHTLIFGEVFTVLVALFAALEVVGHFTGWDLNFEDTIVPSAGFLGEIPIARMSPATGALFFLAGIAILVLILQQKPTSDEKKHLKDCGGIMGSVLVVTAFIFCLAYLFGSPLLYGNGATIPMALTTALGFLLLGISIIRTFGAEAVPVRWFVNSVSSTKAMGVRKRFVFLATIMIVTCLLVMGVITFVLYRHEIQDKRKMLKVIAQTQAHLIESVARYDAKMIDVLKEQNPNYNYIDATISQVMDAHKRYKGFGKTGEFTLARRNENSINFIVQQRSQNSEDLTLIPINSKLAEPIRRALKGESGTVIGLDYRGIEVLAAYELVDIVNLGIVAKIDLAEVRAPFIKSSIIGITVAFFLVFFNLLIFFQIGRPMISSLEKYSKNLEKEIEERKSSEKKLKESTEFLERNMQLSPFAMWISDDKGTIIKANKAVCENLNLTEEQIVGSYNVFEDMNLQKEGFMPQIKAVFKKLKPTRFNTLWKGEMSGSHNLKKAKELILNASMFPIVDNDGKLINVVCQWVDITERKQAEKALRESEERLSFSIAAAGIGLWDWNIKTGEVIYSDRWTGMLGYSPEEITSDLAGWKKLVHPEDKSQALECIDQYFKGVISTYRNEFRLRNKSGQWQWILACGKILERDEKGVPLRMAGIHLDITQSKESEKEREVLLQDMEKKVEDRTSELGKRISESEKLNRGMVNLLEDVNSGNKKLENALQDLEVSNQELNAFSYSVSHDLRAPLRAVNGFVQILLEDYGTKFDSEGKRVCNIISESARDMGRLIDELLTFSKLGRVDMAMVPVNMESLANSVYQDLTIPEERKRIDFHISSIPDINADPTLIKQVWQNLIENAIKFSSKKKRVKIEISCKNIDKEVIYSIRDSGAGFDMQYVDKIFGVFQRLHKANEFEGTGVGMAIVQRIIKRHGGRIWGEGQVDKGAIFYFTLKNSA
jgi:PAS domain S-box-containing protein